MEENSIHYSFASLGTKLTWHEAPARHAAAADFSVLGTQKTPIEKTELRGITLPQLEQLDDFIERHADEHGVLNGWLDREGQPLHKDRINLYDVVKYVVKPATEEHKCSYVELVAPAGTSSQRPKWFVSHWWGEPVKDFIKALKEHARVRIPTSRVPPLSEWGHSGTEWDHRLPESGELWRHDHIVAVPSLNLG